MTDVNHQTTLAPPAPPVPPSTELSPPPAARADAALFLTMTTLYFFTVFLRHAVPGNLFNELQIGFHATAGQITALATIALGIYALLQVPVGLAADRWGAARPLLVGGVLLCAGSLALPMAHSLAALDAAMVLVAIGSSSMYLCMVKEIDQLFDPSRFAALLGLLLMLGYAGGIVSTAPLTSATAAYGWRPPLLVAGLLCTAGLVATGVLLRRADRRHHRRSVLSRRAFVSMLRTPGVWVMLFWGPVDFSVYMLMQVTLGKKFLQDHCGLTEAHAARVTFAMLVIVVVGSFLGGLAPALIGRRRRPIALAIALINFGASAMLAVGIPRAMGAWWFIAACLLLALAMSLGAVTTALFKEICPPGVTGLAIGTLNGLCYLAVAVVSFVAGRVLDAFQAQAIRTPEAVIYPAAAYRAVFIMLVAASAAALVVAVFTPETRGVQAPEP